VGSPIMFILEGKHEDEPQMCGAQNGCHGNGGYLATGPQKILYYERIFQKRKRL